jgi:predicted RNase H-like HicB family nuclease
MVLPVLLRPGEDGYVVASCPVLPGCISQGRTKEEAVANIREAIALYLEVDPDSAPASTEGWELQTVSV